MSANSKNVSFLDELKRRNVYRVGLAYVVLTWLVLQVIDTLGPILDLPEWAPKLVLTILGVGFPAVMLLAWAFELTPEGIKREKDVDRSQSITSNTGQRLDRITIGVLLIAVSMLLVDKFFISDTPTPTQVVIEDAMPEVVAEVDEAPSIAVLPFVNMSDDKSSAYFSDGLADTMLHMLAQVRGIRVAARTSSFQFRDQAMDISSIGEQLNVGTILEGSVQRAGDKIRITAQLIDVENGFHLWSGNFDRDLDDVFAIQDEIANEVVGALKISLLGESAGTMDRDQTDNLDAYTEYLLGLNALNESSTENLARAVAHLQSAVALDPNYARAWSTLGRAYLEMEDYGALGTTAAIAAARNAASKALDLVAESSEALAILGKAERLDGNREQAGKLLSKAIENGPNDAVALSYYGEFLVSEARPLEALPVIEKAVRLDPLSENILFDLSSLNSTLGRFDEAEEIIVRIRAVNPDSSNASFLKSSISYRRGEFVAAITSMLEAQAQDPDDPEPAGFVALMYLDVDMPGEARRWFDRAEEIGPEHPLSQAAPLFMYYHTRENEEQNVRLARKLLDEKIEPRRGARFIALQVLYEHSLANNNLDRFLEVLDNLYPHLFDDPPHDLDRSWMGAFFVGMTLINSGDRERGAMLIRAGQERRDEFEDAFDRAFLSGVLSRLMLDDRDDALQHLQRYSQSAQWPLSDYTALMYDPTYAPIRDEPAFTALLERYEKTAAEQQQLVQAMNAD